MGGVAAMIEDEEPPVPPDVPPVAPPVPVGRVTPAPPLPLAPPPDVPAVALPPPPVVPPLAVVPPRALLPPVLAPPVELSGLEPDPEQPRPASATVSARRQGKRFISDEPPVKMAPSTAPRRGRAACGGRGDDAKR